MGVTIRDVARRAGVSVATVSRVLNDSGPVSDRTRTRIEEVAARLRYVPNGAARSLVTRRTSTLGALLPDIHGEFFSEVIRTIDGSARKLGYHLLVSGSHSDPEEARAVLGALRGRVDGLLIMSPELDLGTILAAVPHGFPIVLLNHRANGRHPSLSVDNQGGAYAMTRHLLGLGHRRIAIIAGPKKNHEARERLRGYRAALGDAGLRPDPALEIRGDFSESSGYAATDRLLRRGRRPEAIFAANDSMAIGALCALRERGVPVPNGLALAGFDDIPMSRYLAPALTSVHVPIRRLGRTAVERLVAMIEGREPEGASPEGLLRTRVLVRESCGGRGRRRGPEGPMGSHGRQRATGSDDWKRETGSDRKT